MMSLPTLSMTKMPATVVTCVVPPAEEKTGAKAADMCVNGSFQSSVDAAVDSVNIFAGTGVDGSSSSGSGAVQDYLNLPVVVIILVGARMCWDFTPTMCLNNYKRPCLLIVPRPTCDIAAKS